MPFRIQIFYSSCSPVTSGKPVPTPLCQGDIQAQRGFPMEWTPLNTCTRPPSKENSIGSILGSEKGKRTTPRGLFWAPWDTQARPTAALWKKLTSESSIGSQESLIPDTYPPFIGSRPLSQWFILENEHTHTWLIIFGKYLNNLGVRQERAKVVKSMLDWMKTGTGSRALWVCDKELSKSLNLSGPWLPHQKRPFILQKWYKD